LQEHGKSLLHFDHGGACAFYKIRDITDALVERTGFEQAVPSA
jgi:hypothetical protein